MRSMNTSLLYVYNVKANGRWYTIAAENEQEAIAEWSYEWNNHPPRIEKLRRGNRLV